MSSNHCETDFTENHYYRVNQIFLSLLDLWPYRRSKFTKIKNIFYFAIMLSFILVQITSLLTLQITMNSVVMVFSYVIPSISYIIQYYSFYAKSNEVKRMWKNIRDSWNLLKDEAERDIMRQYSSYGELHTILTASSVIGTLLLYAFFEFMPIILDVIFPLNETRPRELHALTEYFVDEEKYFYVILCHWLVGTYFEGFVCIATYTLHFAYVQHICGLLKIASYRIEHSLDEYILYNSIQAEDHTATQNICAAVNIHRRALEYLYIAIYTSSVVLYSEFLKATFAPTFFLIIVISVASLSLNLFRLLEAIILLKNVNELIISILFVGFHFLFMFLANYYGQIVTDHNNEVFEKTYNIRWYMVPVKIQKLLLFIMQNTTKLYVLNVGHLIIISIEGFTKLTSLSTSYFTLIYTLV